MMLQEIPGFDTWKEIQEIHDGFSYDIKYKITSYENEKFLLRISKIGSYDIKKQAYKNLILLSKDIHSSRLVEFGNFNQGKYVYSLFTWIEGELLEKKLSSMSKDIQYKLGYEAGRFLREIHKTPIPIHLESWEVKYQNKIDRKIEAYDTCPLKIEQDNIMLKYIQEHRNLVKKRPQALLHGDYHVGNMVVDKKFNLGIIDYDRLDYGDPWEEFNRIIFCAKLSPDFASAMIHSYFNHDVPDDFFKLMKLYIMVNQIASIPWALQYGEEEVEIMSENFKIVLSWYEKSDIPSWYKIP